MGYISGFPFYVASEFQIDGNLVFSIPVSARSVSYQVVLKEPISLAAIKFPSLLVNFQNLVNAYFVLRFREYELFRVRLKSRSSIFVFPPEVAAQCYFLWEDLGSPDGVSPGFSVDVHAPLGQEVSVNTRRGMWVPSQENGDFSTN